MVKENSRKNSFPWFSSLLQQVLDYDRFSRNDIVGSVKVPLHILRLDSATSTEEVWGEIERERKPPEQIQEVLLSLSYLPSAGRLKVVVLKARNLFPLQVTSSIICRVTSHLSEFGSVTDIHQQNIPFPIFTFILSFKIAFILSIFNLLTCLLSLTFCSIYFRSLLLLFLRKSTGLISKNLQESTSLSYIFLTFYFPTAFSHHFTSTRVSQFLPEKPDISLRRRFMLQVIDGTIVIRFTF